jgi:hypothetical protein
MGSWDSVVGIVTRYGLEGPGIESRWGEIFCTYPDRLQGTVCSHSAQHTRYTGHTMQP